MVGWVGVRAGSHSRNCSISLPGVDRIAWESSYGHDASALRSYVWLQPATYAL
jgi:hypothetical protein